VCGVVGFGLRFRVPHKRGLPRVRQTQRALPPVARQLRTRHAQKRTRIPGVAAKSPRPHSTRHDRQNARHTEFRSSLPSCRLTGIRTVAGFFPHTTLTAATRHRESPIGINSAIAEYFPDSRSLRNGKSSRLPDFSARRNGCPKSWTENCRARPCSSGSLQLALRPASTGPLSISFASPMRYRTDSVA
jgi:hypothetical protein